MFFQNAFFQEYDNSQPGCSKDFDFNLAKISPLQPSIKSESKTDTENRDADTRWTLRYNDHDENVNPNLCRTVKL